ncbi:LysR family transcriptional regulator [Clostridium aciditolerans]|uniref:LysR family transcriptional regulator n=1 Tax=Clostridium aciditolerans TaxID=339861 RepID=A0A934HSN6_9CLOT|nr:LysR family transcriptional regulator [Clostridium aciditolerans]MBI6871129.1 LysR family transcriptional regulator [Clostridium aciditolerans]
MIDKGCEILDIKKLIYFVTIVDEGQITRAANRLRIGQPPLSMQLKGLEDELGVILIKRTNKNFELTPAGQTFYKRAKEVLNSIDGMITEVREQQDGKRGKLSIGTVMSCVPYLSPLLMIFNDKYPLVSFQIWEEDSRRIEELLQNRDIELGIIRLPFQSKEATEMRNFSIHHIQSEPLVALQSSNGTFFKEKTISIKELNNQPLLVLRGQGEYNVFHRFVETCNSFGFNPKIICESSDVTTLMTLAESGLGIAIIPKIALQIKMHNNLSFAEIIPNINSETALIWIEDRYLSEAAQNFKDTLINYIK